MFFLHSTAPTGNDKGKLEDVTFVDYDNTVLKTERVNCGGTATPPRLPEHDGMEFKRWEKDYTNVHKDLYVRASYAVPGYEMKMTMDYHRSDLPVESFEASLPIHPFFTIHFGTFRFSRYQVNREVCNKVVTGTRNEKIWEKALPCQKKALPLPSIFAKTSFINSLTYYESVRNRFHFNSRFV